MNTQSIVKSIVKLDSWCSHFNSISDARIEFSKKYITCLEVWQQSDNNAGILSQDSY